MKRDLCGKLVRQHLDPRSLVYCALGSSARTGTLGSDATAKALVAMWERRAELDGFAPTMEACAIRCRV